MTTTAAPASLRIDGLEVRYGDLVALHDVSFSVEAGSVLALVGPNGAGKSSLARTIAGLVPASAGTIHVGGDDVTSWTADKIRRAGLAYVPEGRGIFPTLSVADNLKMAVRQAGGRAEQAAAMAAAEEMFPILAQRRTQLAGRLSGGEQQMLGLARALAVTPRVIVVDEMSLGLAPLVVEQAFERLAVVKEQGITIIVIEQFVHRALQLADQCVIVSHGTVGWDGAAADAGDEVLNSYLGVAEEGTPRAVSVSSA